MDLNDPIIQTVGGIVASFVVAAGILREWHKERKADEEAKRASSALVTPTMQTIAALGTPMQALAVASSNDLHLKLEELTGAVHGNTTAITSQTQELKTSNSHLEVIRNELREERAIQKGIREGEDRERRRRERER